MTFDFKTLHYPVFTPPEHFTREGFPRKWLAEGLFTRYTIHAKAAGQEFIVEKVDDPKRLPTFDPANPNEAAAIKTVIDRLQLELGVIEKTGFISYFPHRR